MREYLLLRNEVDGNGDHLFATGKFTSRGLFECDQNMARMKVLNISISFLKDL